LGERLLLLNSAPTVILAAVAVWTRRIRLTSAVIVLSAADPVRVFQEFATLDLLSNGRTDIVFGRNSFIEAFPQFGFELEDYDSPFAEKLDLLLNIRENMHVHWSGKHRTQHSPGRESTRPRSTTRCRFYSVSAARQVHSLAPAHSGCRWRLRKYNIVCHRLANG
jgi:alkanesulfonate monooxygenase SsuD/methylene tetrahydromethanopterin reductase-like flavin-dependent oxidoreductase (luciferase family)